MKGNNGSAGNNRERAASSSNLIVVSNRLPFVLNKDGETLSRKSSAGGLVTAVAPVLIQSKGNFFRQVA
jgi:trehalose 6-phosphate synthase/phosphatase